MRNDLPSGNLTLLLTDIEGSTRLLQRLGAAGYARAQADHRELLREAFRRHGGVEVDTQGDAFFYVFASARECFLAAVAGQRALAAHNWAHGDPVLVRMGMHTGSPQRTEEGYVGIAVNQAARIAAAGHGGQVLVSRHTADALDEGPEDDIPLRDLGEYRLKDFDEPQRLFQAVIPELPSDFSAPRSLHNRPSNLPAALTPFVGRTGLVTGVRDLLLRDATRAVTLVGTGGTGKTRLGLRVATELVHSLDDGAFFVSLAAVRNPERVPAAVSAALNVKEESGASPEQTVTGHLRDKRLLLLLDNFEQVAGAASFVARLLAACPGIKVLTTSREPLRLSGERVVPVPPLDVPDADEAQTVAAAGACDAVRLFVDRAQAVLWDFELTDENVDAVTGICRRVDGLPLGIELAAAKLYQMSPAALHEALDERLGMLTDGAVDLLDHQRTLKDLIAWSYDLLDPQLQALWRRLSVFAGGFTLRAAATVCDTNRTGTTNDDVAALVRKSLLIPGPVSGSGAENVVRGPGAHRYTMLSTLREYAAHALVEACESEVVEDRFHDWCLGLAEDASPHLRGADSARWFSVLDPETTNLRVAMDRCVAEQRPKPETALRLGAALWFFWYSRGFLTLGRELLHKALLVGSEADASLRADASVAAATLARQQNLLDEAQAAGEQALALARRQDDPEAAARALSELGAIASRREDYDGAADLLNEALRVLRRLDNRERMAVTLNLLGIVEQLRDEPAAARPLYEESLGLGRALGDGNIVGTALVNLGEIAQTLGQPERAAGHFGDSLAVWSELDQGLAIAYCLEMLAGLAAGSDNAERAARLFGAADRLRRKQDIPVEASNLERYRKDVDRARSALGAEAFDAAWEQGSRLSREEAVALALTGLSPPPLSLDASGAQPTAS